MQGPSKDPSTLKSAFSGPHSYETISPICKTGDPSCSVFNVFQTMLEDVRYVAPTRDTGPVKQDGSATAFGLGGITTHIDQDNLSTTNVTTEDHLLHPGTVTREVRQMGEDVVVVTKGDGGGLFPTLNNTFAPFVWAVPNSMLRSRFKEKPSKATFKATKDLSAFKIDTPKDSPTPEPPDFF